MPMVEKFQNMHIGTINLDHMTSSTKLIIDAIMKLYQRIINKRLLVRRLNLTANHVLNELTAQSIQPCEQLNLFTNYSEEEKKKRLEQMERNLQRTMLEIKKKYGKNAIIKGMNLQDGGTTIERNGQIGGHKG